MKNKIKTKRANKGKKRKGNNQADMNAKTPQVEAVDKKQQLDETEKPEVTPATDPTLTQGEGQVLDSEEVGEDLTLDDAIEVIARLQLQLRDAETAQQALQDQNLRLQADFDNFRKRKTKELSETVRFANQELIRELLPVLDNFERTLRAIDETDNLSAIKTGIELVSNSLRKQLTKIGVEPIESVGKAFDSELFEAISSVPVEDDAQKGMVIDEVEKGYRLKDKVIRFSKVIVGE